MQLRPYQQKAIDDLYKWLGNNAGHPCLVLPTGAGKSVIIAHLCKYALQNWPETKILKLTHVKELLEQNHEKLKTIWPNAPVGLYSAGMGKRNIDAITFAGIQSVRDKAGLLGHIDICLIDECHLVSHEAQGSYRKLIDDLLKINPSMRIIGLTATPYRLGHGLITDKPALFDDLIDVVTIPELQAAGHLADLRSKVTSTELSVEGVHKRGGDYIESELQAAVDTELQNEGVVREVIRLAGDRKAWLFFCTGVEHAHHIRDVLMSHGISAATITGDTPKTERAQILDEYRDGKIQALTNANVLTTGFDYPDIDLIAMLRPTMSPGLYVQMAGRGLRPKSHTDHCLVLDFAGVVKMHGPITAVKAPEKVKKSDGEGIMPSKICPECDEIVAIQTRICKCGYVWEVEKKSYQLHQDDIMGREEVFHEIEVDFWLWQIETSRTSGKQMVTVTYHGKNLSDRTIKEYFCVYHGGYTAQKAMEEINRIMKESGASEADTDVLTRSTPPQTIRYIMDGKFAKVVKRTWDEIPF